MTTTHPIVSYINSNRQDAFLWKAKRLFADAGEDAFKRASALEAVANTCALIGTDYIREDYIKKLSKEHKVAINILKKQVETIIAKSAASLKKSEARQEHDEGSQWELTDENIKELRDHGFYEKRNGIQTGYYFSTGGDYEAKTNFVIEPITHKISERDNTRIMQLDNGIYKSLMEIPSRAFIAMEQMKGFLADMGNFFFTGAKGHYDMIIAKLMPKFEPSFELKTLGWQGSQKFFAWCNRIWSKETGIIPMSEKGMVQFNDKNYFSPASSSLQIADPDGGDLYENDRVLSYEESPLTLEIWSQLVCSVYGNNKGSLVIASVVIALFRDIVFRIDNNCPFIYCYGEPQSGKSKFMESILAFFFKRQILFNLNQGTDFAFFNHSSRFKNCPVGYNEFDEDGIPENWYRAFKGFYDGEGRVRGKGGNKDKVETQKVNGFVVFGGQTLSTKDSAAVLTRSIVVPFDRNDERSAEQVHDYNILKGYEKQGLSSLIIPVLEHREEFEKNYGLTMNETFKQLKKEIKDSGNDYKERIARNYSMFAAAMKIFMETIKLPFTWEEFFAFCQAETIRLSGMISDNNSLADFWKSVEFLLDRNEILEGWDFKIAEVTKLSISYGRGDTRSEVFPNPTKVLFIRLSNIVMLYQQLMGKVKRTNSLNEASIEHYLKSQKGFIGKSYRSIFINAAGESTNTSSMVFLFSEVPVNLERLKPEKDEDPGEKVTLTGDVISDPEAKDVNGIPFIKYKIQQEEPYTLDGMEIKKTVNTSCYDPTLKNMAEIGRGDLVEVTGYLKNKSFVKDGKTINYRTLDVEKYTRLEEGMKRTWEVAGNPGSTEKEEELPF